ncbi:hypothetical protein AVEN_96507-1 [Araneus ventricosus]|uniref:Transposase Tc1-like domain-containing protein n=1 Tax=Araneus ventricosus TaxID=182803 RepID=A0A4Y2CVZ6_ARAVE|nr:hypothetical protein AVEN_96507-1 [Araneus ventricosus]
MQITGNHQMARIVRHNDESVREGYIRNGGKEVKLFTSALKAFQCNNRIVMAQRKHLDDFLRGRIIRRLECGRTQLEVSEELGIAQSVISRLWQRFQDDGNVSRCYSSGRPRVTTPNEDRYLAVTAKRNRRSTASDLSRQLSSATDSVLNRCRNASQEFQHYPLQEDGVLAPNQPKHSHKHPVTLHGPMQAGREKISEVLEGFHRDVEP